MTKKSGIYQRSRSYRGWLIELRQTEEGWAASFRKFAHIEFTDLGVPFPSQKEAIQHAKRFIDSEIHQEAIVSQFEVVFDELLQRRYPLALIFSGLAEVTYRKGWAEQSALLEQAVNLSPGELR